MICYKNFFNNICYHLTVESKGDDEIDSQLQLLVSGTSERKICADGDTDLNENFADVEGARIAFETMKFENSEIDDFLKKRALSEFDFTNEQMFFIAAAQNYCNKKMNDDSHMAADLQDSDPHGTDKVRVNAMAMQMQEFADAFSCSATDAMATTHEDKCYLLSKD
jgi:predicted metalloendopeptidase